MAPQWFHCSICGLQRLGVGPVHGDNPCPMKVEEHAATMALLELRKAAEAGGSFAISDMNAMVKKMAERMLGADDDD